METTRADWERAQIRDMPCTDFALINTPLWRPDAQIRQKGLKVGTHIRVRVFKRLLG